MYFLGGLGSCNPFVSDASLHFLLLSFDFVVEVQSDELYQLFQDDQEPLKRVRFLPTYVLENGFGLSGSTLVQRK